MMRAARFINAIFLVIVVVIGILIYVNLTNPRLGARVNSLGSLILILVTLVYAWLTQSIATQAAASAQAMREGNELSREMIREMRETRKQAVTPHVRIVGHGGNMDFYRVRIKNIGNAPAIDVEVSLRDQPRNHAVILYSTGLLAPSDPAVEFDMVLRQYASRVDLPQYEMVARYRNTLGESFETHSVFSKDRDGFPSATEVTHSLTRSSG